jgi:hypothetical protein
MADDWDEIMRRHNDAETRILLTTLVVLQGIVFLTHLLALLAR